MAVLGAGSWGTALAILLANKGCDVSIWGKRKEHIEKIIKTGENKEYLPDVSLPSNIQVTWDLERCLYDKDYIIMVIPSQAMREVFSVAKRYIKDNSIIISASKGLEVDTLLRMTEVLQEELPAKMHNNIAVISGPSHAEEVSLGLPTAVVASAFTKETARKVQDLFITTRFRVYTNPDIIGVELGGAFKNIIALGTGINDGLEFGDNSRAGLMTRGIAEITRLGNAMGANPLTFLGLSGVGDLIVTCDSMHSRNRRAGILIGKGKTIDEVFSTLKMAVEGIRTTEAAYKLQQKYDTEMPITTELYKVLFKSKTPSEALETLMSRARKREIEEIVNLNLWDW